MRKWVQELNYRTPLQKTPQKRPCIYIQGPFLHHKGTGVFCVWSGQNFCTPERR